MTDFTEKDAVTQLEVRRSWRTLLSDFATLATGEAAGRLIGLGAVLAMARRLGPDGFGVITFGLTMIAWFAVFQDSGTELLNVREVARRPQSFRPTVERVLGLRLTMSILAMAGFALLVSFMSKAAIHRNTLLGFTLLLPALALNLRMMVLGVRGARAVAAGNIVARTVLLIGVLLLVTDRNSLHLVPFLQLAAELAYAAIILILVSRRFGWIRPRVDLASWKSTLQQSYPLMANAIARGITLSFDVFLIGVILRPSDVGVYGAASKPSLFVMGALGLFGVSFLSTYSSVPQDVSVALLRRTLGTALLLTIPAAVILSAGSGTIIPLLFGDRYARGADVLAIASWGIPLAALAGPLWTVLLCANQQVVIMRNAFAVAAFVVVADGVAVPLGGIDGAAVVGVASAAIGLVVNYRSAVSRKLIPPIGVLLSGRMPTPAERGAGA